MSDVESLKSVYNVFYDTATNVPNDIINIIIYGYLDIRKKCSIYHIPMNQLDKCYVCNLSYCTKCEPDITMVSYERYCYECYWGIPFRDIVSCSICQSKHYGYYRSVFKSVNYCRGCRKYICTKCDEVSHKNKRCDDNLCKECHSGTFPTGYCDNEILNRYCTPCFSKYNTSQKCTICNVNDNVSDVKMYKCVTCSQIYCRLCNPRHIEYPLDYYKKHKYYYNVENGSTKTYCNICFVKDNIGSAIKNNIFIDSLNRP
jgi:hypothetical protein